MESIDVQISVVTPVYNEEDSLCELYERIVSTLESMGRSFEVIAIDDGSTDGSLAILKELHDQDKRLRVLRLSRNFGQSPALYAGFAAARGEYVAMLDADLQVYPEDIPRLIEKLEEGYDMVSGKREERRDSYFRLLSSRVLNLYFKRVAKVSLSDYGCSLKAFRTELVEHMGLFTHRCRYLPADVAMLGGNVTEVMVRHSERTEGKSKYGPFRLLRAAFDLLTSITTAPLQFIGVAGFLFALVGFAMGIKVAYIRITTDPLNELASIVGLEQLRTVLEQELSAVFALFFFLGGIQLLATGLMCEYVGRIYIEVQRRPYYIVREELE